MRKAKIGLALLGALEVGCTFYTACPDTSNPPPANNGGTGNGSGGNGGSSGGGAGPVLAKWVNATSNLAGVDSTCGNLSLLLAKGDRVLAGVNPGRLWATTDGGDSWTELGQGKGSAEINANIVSMEVDPEHPETFWISGIYGSHGVFRTDDDGETFIELGNIGHNDVVTIDFTDPKRRFLMAGGHEQTNVVYRSTDGGENWESIGENFPSGTPVSSYPHIIRKDFILFGSAGYAQGKAGIFLSTDTGDSWERVASTGGLGKPLVTSTGDIYWATENGGIAKSEDGGMTWDEVLPADSVSSSRPLVELPDGRLAVLTPRDGIKISDDGLETLTPAVAPTPFQTAGITYSDKFRAFFIAHSDCGQVVLDDAVMRADFDYEDKGGGAGGASGD